MTKALSRYFTLEEMTFSETASRLGIPNQPTDSEELVLIGTCLMLDKARVHLGHPISVSSGLRRPAVNKSVGGSDSSYHVKGQAADFNCRGYGSPLVVAKALLALSKRDPSFVFHELILEFGNWVHLAVPKKGETPKMKVLTYKMVNGEKVCYQGLVS